MFEKLSSNFMIFLTFLIILRLINYLLNHSHNHNPINNFRHFDCCFLFLSIVIAIITFHVYFVEMRVFSWLHRSGTWNGKILFRDKGPGNTIDEPLFPQEQSKSLEKVSVRSRNVHHGNSLAIKSMALWWPINFFLLFIKGNSQSTFALEMRKLFISLSASLTG